MFFAQHVVLVGRKATPDTVAVDTADGGHESRLGSRSCCFGELNGGATKNC
jgi:hypothetical protein